jgi:Beta-lactamase class A
MRTLISILWISFFPLAAAAQGDDLSYRLKKVIKDKKAEIGIAVILDAQDTVTVNNDDRYPLMSVFKFHQALAVADYLDRNGLTPDTEIFIPEEELVPDTYSPLRKEFPEGEISLSVSRLLEYSLQLSDNNACDILFEHTGGPAATDRYVRSLGLRNFAIAATEQQMHDDPQTCYENWSTPLEAAALLELLVTEQILTPTLREMIRQNLINCKTGADRLPKPLSGTGAVIGHKTGTSDRDERGIFAGTNDPGFVILPDGTPLYHRRLHQRFGGKPGNKCPNR